MKIFLATNNPRKVDRYRFLLEGQDIDFVTANDLGIEAIDIVEGSDIEDNARRKALAYRDATGLPILGNDSAFMMNGVEQDPAQVKRAALEGRSEHEMTQEEIAEAVVAHYKKIVDENGGSLSAKWVDSYVLAYPDGSEKSIEAERSVTMGKIKDPVEPYWPLRSMYTVDATGKYPYDQTDDEVRVELAPITKALVELLGLNDNDTRP